MTCGKLVKYKYGNDSLSITDLLEKNEIVNFLEKGKKSTYPSLREKLRKELRKHGDDLEHSVVNYNLQNPRQRQEREIQDNLYRAQRRRANLPKKDTKGNVFFGPERPPQPPKRKRIGVIQINGENLTARQVFDRYPQLRQHYNLGSKRLLKDSTLHAKLRKDSKTNKIPHQILNEDPPDFREIENHFNGTVTRFKLDNSRIKFHNIPSLRKYLKPQMLELIRTHPNTKSERASTFGW